MRHKIAGNKANAATRKINLANSLGSGEWEREIGPKNVLALLTPDSTDGGLRIFSRLRKYLDYLRSFYPNSNLAKTNEKVLRFAFGAPQGRDSEMGTVIPVCGYGIFKHARVSLIHGKPDLLLGTNIIRKLDITVSDGGDLFTVGQSACEMMTFSEKRHCVFPLVPTAFAYAKLNEFFLKITQIGN